MGLKEGLSGAALLAWVPMADRGAERAGCRRAFRPGGSSWWLASGRSELDDPAVINLRLSRTLR